MNMFSKFKANFLFKNIITHWWLSNEVRFSVVTYRRPPGQKENSSPTPLRGDGLARQTARTLPASQTSALQTPTDFKATLILAASCIKRTVACHLTYT